MPGSIHETGVYSVDIDDVNARINTHEQVCTERYNAINAQLKRLESWFVAMVGATMALMATIIIRGLP